MVSRAAMGFLHRRVRLLRWCVEHQELWDAKADGEEWELALSILRPWAESAGYIDNDILTEIMEQAVSDAAHELRQQRVRERRAETALEA